MKTFWSRLLMTALLCVGMAGTCLAQSQGPEIDASSGSMALTLIAGTILWLQQARRRR